MKKMFKPLIVGAAIASLMTGTALAQGKPTGMDAANKAGPASGAMSNPASGDTTKKGTASAPKTETTGMSTAETGGIVMGKSAAGPVRYGTADSSNLLSSKLVGVKVYNNKNDSIGEVADLAIDNGKTVSGVVLSVGGFLGVGERYVLVEPSSLAVRNDNGTWKAFINTDKDSLKSAPQFSYQSMKNKKS